MEKDSKTEAGKGRTATFKVGKNATKNAAPSTPAHATSPRTVEATEAATEVDTEEPIEAQATAEDTANRSPPGTTTITRLPHTCLNPNPLPSPKPTQRAKKTLPSQPRARRPRRGKNQLTRGQKESCFSWAR